MPSPSIFHVTHLQPKALYLTPEPGRRGSFTDIEPLKQSILAEGLKTPLRVRLVTEDRYKIIHGRRRYMAIMKLIEEGHKDRFRYIPCNIARSGDDVSDAVEYLLSNTVPMLDPGLVAEIIDLLSDAGLTLDEISLRSGLARDFVAKESRASRKQASSLVSRLLPKNEGAALEPHRDGKRAATVDDLLAAICAATPNAAQRRRLALALVKAVEDYQAQRASANQATRSILDTIDQALGKTRA